MWQVVQGGFYRFIITIHNLRLIYNREPYQTLPSLDHLMTFPVWPLKMLAFNRLDAYRAEKAAGLTVSTFSTLHIISCQAHDAPEQRQLSLVLSLIQGTRRQTETNLNPPSKKDSPVPSSRMRGIKRGPSVRRSVTKNQHFSRAPPHIEQADKVAFLMGYPGALVLQMGTNHK